MCVYIYIYIYIHICIYVCMYIYPSLKPKKIPWSRAKSPPFDICNAQEVGQGFTRRCTCSVS